MSNTDSDPDLDAAILAGDQQREQMIIQRQITRRRMAIIAFVQFVAGGAGVILGGLLIPTWSVRIDHMGTFLSLYFGALAAIIGWYWGLGTYESRGTGFNPITGMMGGASGYGGFGQNSMYPPTQSYSPTPLTHPRLTKTTQPGTDPAKG